MHRAAALNRPYHEASAIAADSKRRSWLFQLRRDDVSWVKGLVTPKEVVEPPHVDEAILVGGHKRRPLATHVVDGHGDIRLADLLHLRGRIHHPELHKSVPAPTHHHTGTLVHKTRHIFDRRIMSPHDSIRVRLDVPLQNTVISTRHQYRHVVLLPADPQYRPLPNLLVVDWFGLESPRFLILIRPHAAEATKSAYCQHLLAKLLIAVVVQRRGELDTTNGVVLIGQLDIVVVSVYAVPYCFFRRRIKHF